MCQRSFKFFVLPLGFFGEKKFSKCFYGCVDLSRILWGIQHNLIIDAVLCEYAGCIFLPDKVQPDPFCG